MPGLSTHPGSSTPKQRMMLHRIKRHKGWTDDQLHDAIGEQSTTHLSCLQASRLIDSLGHVPLPNEPGQKPRPYARKKERGVIRMITADQVDQITRLMCQYFDTEQAGYAWLRKNFKVDCASRIGTAWRAGQIIHVLKEMHARTSNRVTSHSPKEAIET